MTAIEKEPPTVDSIRVSVGKMMIQSNGGTVTTEIDGFKLRKNDNRMLVRFERLLVSTSTLKRAVSIKYFTFIAIGDKHDYTVNFANTRENPIIFDLDQAFVDYVSSFGGVEQVQSEANDSPPLIIRSLKVSPIKLRVSFKPGDAIPTQTSAVPEILRWVPIKDAAIKIGMFECFDKNVNDIGVDFGAHILSDRKNLARLAGGVQ
jgi:hypothetical protein